MAAPQESQESDEGENELATPLDAFKENLYELSDDDRFLNFVDGLILLMSGPGSLSQVATPQDAIVQDMAVDSGSIEIVDSPVFLSDGSLDPANCLTYYVTIGSVRYVLYLSGDYIDNIYIDSSNRLWNMSSSNITGRLFPESSGFEPTATTGYVLYLGPCLGNNFSNNRHYGSPNYYRRYYWSGNNLTYDTTYGVVVVDEYVTPLLTSHVPYYLILVMVGACFILLLIRKSRR